MEVYLDNSATTKPSEEVIEMMIKALREHYGNPSSLHRKGVEVEKLIKAARKQVARSLGVKDEEIIFTSGGTESNNIAILGIIEGNRRKGNRIITSKIEHPSVLNVFKSLETRGLEVIYLDVDEWGKIDINQLQEAITDNTLLISLMHVNNEVGTIQPIEEISKLLQRLKSKPFFHVDAIQSFGKVKLNLGKLNIDMLSISGHKIHGPKGIGAIFVRKGVKVSPIFLGGNQETGIRSGTENVPGILGLGVAAEKMWEGTNTHHEQLLMLKDRFLRRIKNEIPNIKINGLEGNDGAPHILNISFPGIRGEVLLHSLEQDRIYVSTGSACSSKKSSQSHVLKAMKLKDDEIEGAIRFSFSYNNTAEEIDYAVDRLKKHVEELRKIMMR
ncbi:cysteine desulfurase [Anaerosolibacter carboniphilus]|uniref:Cysteine desulfurase n=1 Tax=Anaerosolibacter carboniphilus TaxID=1417629 RepID=A0A841KQL0_9FIRM|nr:cysteine desulfurase [Anaerosolibacter carboniphilus]